jgi:DNA-binding NarL/FixJ family response regulator
MTLSTDWKPRPELRPAGPQMSGPVGVFVASDVRLHREGVALLLGTFPAVKVLGSGTIRDTLLALRATAVDVVLLDTVPPPDPNLVVTLRQLQCRLRIMTLGIRESTGGVLACAVAGVDGFAWMDAGPAEVVVAIQSVMRDELFCSPRVAATLYHSIGSMQTAEAAPLTDREYQVVKLIGDGLSNKEIAQRLGIEACTAKNHVQNILQKLKVHRRGQVTARLGALIAPWRRVPKEARAPAGVEHDE